MATYTESATALGARIMKYRKSHKLTQADLADRYKVSGPAIFKFEKGFVTPSLRLWQQIAADIGIAEKEAVLLWVREKLPSRLHGFVTEAPVLNVASLKKDLEGVSKESDSQKKLRDAILKNPEISPSLKKFVSQSEIWRIMKPTHKELIFLVELDKAFPLLTVEQFRDALLVGREIASAK
jgi:transcriptional regulator with XRE-family HTH domain